MLSCDPENSLLEHSTTIKSIFTPSILISYCYCSTYFDLQQNQPFSTFAHYTRVYIYKWPLLKCIFANGIKVHVSKQMPILLCVHASNLSLLVLLILQHTTKDLTPIIARPRAQSLMFPYHTSHPSCTSKAFLNVCPNHLYKCVL